MSQETQISALKTVLQTIHDPEQFFSQVIPIVGDLLNCDRCFLYLRNPETGIGKVTHCWRRSDRYPNVFDPDWKPEPPGLAQDDPLFAAALRAAPSVFVDDVETADPQVVNRAFEQTNFGHRALIHAHLRSQGQLWGILQPCVFDQPRFWSEFDRSIMSELESALTPKAIAYVQSKNPT